MKIGIVRHFKVDYEMEKYMDTEAFKRYVAAYDEADVIANELIIDEKAWGACYCSDMKRAIETAHTIYKGKIEESSLIREVPMDPVRNDKHKRSRMWWEVAARTAWLFDQSSQIEGKSQTRQRAEAFYDKLDQNQDVLVVSHGFFLCTFVKLLKEKGFKGKIPRRFENGQLYILEK